MDGWIQKVCNSAVAHFAKKLASVVLAVLAVLGTVGVVGIEVFGAVVVYNDCSALSCMNAVVVVVAVVVAPRESKFEFGASIHYSDQHCKILGTQ